MDWPIDAKSTAKFIKYMVEECRPYRVDITPNCSLAEQQQQQQQRRNHDKQHPDLRGRHGTAPTRRKMRINNTPHGQFLEFTATPGTMTSTESSAADSKEERRTDEEIRTSNATTETALVLYREHLLPVMSHLEYPCLLLRWSDDAATRTKLSTAQLEAIQHIAAQRYTEMAREIYCLMHHDRRNLKQVQQYAGHPDGFRDDGAYSCVVSRASTDHHRTHAEGYYRYIDTVVHLMINHRRYLGCVVGNDYGLFFVFVSSTNLTAFQWLQDMVFPPDLMPMPAVTSAGAASATLAVIPSAFAPAVAHVADNKNEKRPAAHPVDHIKDDLRSMSVDKKRRLYQLSEALHRESHLSSSIPTLHWNALLRGYPGAQFGLETAARTEHETQDVKSTGSESRVSESKLEQVTAATTTDGKVAISSVDEKTTPVTTSITATTTASSAMDDRDDGDPDANEDEEDDEEAKDRARKQKQENEAAYQAHCALQATLMDKRKHLEWWNLYCQMRTQDTILGTYVPNRPLLDVARR